MKLRNKNTGEIVDLWHGVINSDMNGENIVISSMKPHEQAIRWNDKKYAEWIYSSLDELNEEWEDYKPKEPLIKDEKVRDIVRLWAKYYNVDILRYLKLDGIDGHYFKAGLHTIDIDVETLEVGNVYTIEELCGDEELRPVIVNDIKYESYDDYLKRRRN